MEAQVKVRTDRGSVRPTVQGNGHQADGSTHAPVTPSVDPVERLAARRRFDALVAEHLPALRVRASQLCRSHCDAEDVVQEALLRAFRAATQIEDPTRIRSWLVKIVTNTFIDFVRKQRRQPHHVELTGDMPMPEAGEASPWEHITPEDVRAAVDQLPDDVRDTYRMFALEDCDYAAIAEAQHIPKATVGSRIFRARKQLRILLGGAEPR